MVGIIKESVNFKAEAFDQQLAKNPNVSKEDVSSAVQEYMTDILEHLISLMHKPQREQLINDLARQYNIKITDWNTKKQPMHIEMVRDNFNQIVSALKIYEEK